MPLSCLQVGSLFHPKAQIFLFSCTCSSTAFVASPDMCFSMADAEPEAPPAKQMRGRMVQPRVDARLVASKTGATKATANSKLPVYVFIQGGGFNNNGNANLDGTEIVRASGKRIVVVNFNYRVGPYGFLASQEIVANKTLSLNNGLKDQRQLLKWVNEHIAEVCFTLFPNLSVTDMVRSLEVILGTLPSAVPALAQALWSSS